MKLHLIGCLVLVACLLNQPCAYAAEPPADFPLPAPHELKQRNAVPPQMLKVFQPEYPVSMRYAGLEGRVLLEFIVDKEGHVRNPHVARSNNPWFERPAIDALLKWKFKPATIDGRPVHTRVQQEITFNLHGGGQDLWQISKTKDHGKLPEEVRWDVPPKPVHTNYPIYPVEALREKKSGKTLLQYVVDPKGIVVQARVLESTSPEFAGAALAAIDAWRFQPATRGGTACYAVLNHTWEFKPTGYSDHSVPISDGTQDVLRELKRKTPSIYSGAELDQKVQPLSRRPPIYPSSLRSAGEEGHADIEFFIDRNGDAQLPVVTAASKPEFGYAAVQAVATWRFLAPQKNGKTTICRAQVRVNFSLTDLPAAKTGGAP